MKTLLTITFAFILFLSNTQNSMSQVFSYGIKGGFNLSDVSATGAFSETDMKSGMNIYAFADYYILIAAASLEAGYTQKGFETPFIYTNQMGQETGRSTIKYKINYVDISLLGKLRLPGTVIAPYILAGPSLGIKASTDVSSDDESLNQSLQQMQQMADDFKSTTVGIKFGLGAEITAIPVVSILAEARYNPDLTGAYEQGSVKIKNKVFEFIVGVKF